MRLFFRDLEGENALQQAWLVLSHRHSRYTHEFNADLIDDIFVQDLLEVVQEYTAEFVTYADVLGVDGNRITLFVRLTTELPLKVNGSFLKLPSLPLINDARSLEVQVSGPTVVFDSLRITDHEKKEDSLSAKISFELTASARCDVVVDFLANNRWLDRHLVSVDPAIPQSHPSG